MHAVSNESPGTLALHLTAEADPGIASRLLLPFAKRGLVPDAFVLRRHGNMLRIEISASGLEHGVAGLIAAHLVQVVGVVRAG